MAKEIKYYGQLQPTGVDNSNARRFEALAGLADQVRILPLSLRPRERKRLALLKG